MGSLLDGCKSDARCSVILYTQENMLPLLPNNRLILNGHKLHTEQDMLAYVSKRLKQKDPIVSLDMFVQILSNYDQLQIAIWHSDTFL